MSEDTGRAEGKPPHLDRLSALWRRLNEHKIVQWSVAYVALAYAIQHAIILTSESFEWPNAVPRVSMLLLALGLSLVVTFAWYHGAKASRNFSQAELSILAALLVMSSLLFYVFVRPSEDAAAPAAQQAGVTAARNAAASPKGAISLAVLPFVNLSSDKEQEFFSDGMTEEITSALAKVPDLRVVARTSAFEFKGKNVNIKTMGEELGATHLIEGSVRKAGNRVRITAQLIKADDGTHIWAEDYDRDLTDVFAIQEDIARAITASLRMPLGLKPGQDLVNNRKITPENYQLYLRAKAILRTRGARPITEATALLEQVVARDPGYAPASAQLGLAYALTAGFDPAYFTMSTADLRRLADATMPKAEVAARRAIELDANLADGYLALAVTVDGRGKYLQAEELYSKGLTLDPYSSDILAFYGNLLSGVGRLKEALVLRQRGLALEPLVPIYNFNTAFHLWLNGQNEAAVSILQATAPSAYRSVRLAQIYASEGRYADAADTLAGIPPGMFPPAVVEQAVSLLRTAPRPLPSPQSMTSLGDLDFVYVHVGAPERALGNRERDVEAGLLGSYLADVWHPSYAAARKTERFKALVRKTGLIEYWRAKGWPQWCHPVGADDFACG